MANFIFIPGGRGEYCHLLHENLTNHRGWRITVRSLALIFLVLTLLLWGGIPYLDSILLRDNPVRAMGEFIHPHNVKGNVVYLTSSQLWLLRGLFMSSALMGILGLVFWRKASKKDEGD